LKVIAGSSFLKFKKKSAKNLQLEIDEQIKKIINNPELGSVKRVDLRGVRVHKFKYKSQILLLSYEQANGVLYLYTIGSHENFYRNLKKYL